ncbi:hypothetical protein [Flavobacterium suzhouense]|uniref:Uncharacterized protein n=1 Tax=Flavobacterium suzhouense TaxID=1529638 RepID=A0ABW5NWR8_9FLAO
MKSILQRLPELFFVGLGTYWVLENFIASNTVNWIAVTFVAILIIQLFVQQRIIGMALGLVLGLISAYMMFAVLSEFREFRFYDQAFELLSVGIGIFGSGVIFATAMVYKFVTALQNEMRGEQPLTA